MRQENLKIAIFLIIISIFVYYNTRGNDFVFDDEFSIIKNPYVKSWRYLGQILTRPLSPAGGPGYTRYYRPVKSLTYMFDYHFWQLNPFGYHLTNVILHAIAAILVYRLIRLLFFDFKIALLSSFLFTIHPLQTEAVAYISGRADSLTAIFILLSLYLFVKYRRDPTPKKKFFYFGSLLAYVLALLSKELALILPLALILCDSLPEQQKVSLSVGKRLLAYLPFAVLGGLFIFLRLKVLTFGCASPVFSQDLLPRILTFFKVFFIYLGLLICPHNLHIGRTTELLQNFYQPAVLIFIALLVLIIVLGILSYRRYRLIYFGILWFVIFLLPQSNVLLPMITPIAEHFLYLPSIGLFLIIAWVILRVPNIKLKRLRITFLVGVMLVVYCVFLELVTLKANRNWRNSLTLWENTLRFSPRNLIARINLGVDYLSQQRFKEAEEQFLIAEKLSTEKGHGEVYYNLGAVHFKQNKFSRASKEIKKALEIAPNNLFIRVGLGKLYLDARRFKLAEEQFIYTLKIEPLNIDATYGLAKAYDKQGFLDKAITQYQQALTIERNHLLTLLDLGFAYSKAGSFAQAEEQLLRAVKHWPGSAKAHYSLGKFYWEKAEVNKASAQWEKALKINPMHLPTRIHLKAAKEAR